MKISATSSGGFAGLREHYEIDTRAHPAGQALEAALAGCGFFSAPPASDQAGSEALGADIAQWRITVESPDSQHTITFAEDGSEETTRWQQLVAKIRANA
ncbi:protealysin inhibitor emfourin [Janthinobacterium psychrotolerans]|uniref:Uncharacterized protein n=1 Tax=Janthinobacterium psychrotolerans TaxID=1747903 RepID=A0A1A7C5I2_9BURK|nr:protealysin inhibitor emfourin [Janthinobacterium psychrotolerans]OBV40020.1 hypothetical protein ASR47_101375 [Janthinobacterium psychrotolerans]